MIGKKLNQYEILEKLGSGGMGEVYRARDEKLNREVALKILSKESARSAVSSRRFEREARAVAALKHPNIVTIYSVEEAFGEQFITMELVDGQPLSQVIPKGGMALDRFFDVAVPLADAVSSAHANGITHRDLKPANIMLDADGRVKVLDFGLAKLVPPPTGADDATLAQDDSATQEGKILGTVSYMSPEQAEGQPVDHRSDIFSLGIILYEMATGERPFKGDTSIATISSILKDSPPPVTEFKQSLPRHLGRIVGHCLAKQPDRRYQSALDLRNDLHGLRKEVDSGELLATGETTAVRLPRPLARRLGIVAAGALLLLAAGWFAWSLLDGDPAGTAATAGNDHALAVMYFENLTDESDADRLGRIAASLLTPALSSSGQLQMVSEQRLYDVLKKLKKQEVATIDRTVASDVAREAGVERVIFGQVSQAGSRLALTSQVVEVATGRVIASQRAEGEGREALFGLVDEIAGQILADLATETTGQTPVADITTDSVAAYQAYQEGVAAYREHRWDEAQEAFDRALAHDPRFALAYFYRSRPFYPGGSDDQLRSLENALHFSARASPVERGLIEAAHLWKVAEDPHGAIAKLDSLRPEFPQEARVPYLKGRILMQTLLQSEAASAAFEQALELNPDDNYTLNSLAFTLVDSGRREDGLRTIRRYVELEPDNPNAHDSLGELAWMVGDLPTALEAFEQAVRIDPTFFSHRSLGYVHAMTGRFEDSRRQLATYGESGNPGWKANALTLQSLVDEATGRFAAAIRDLENAADFAVLNDDPWRAAELCFMAADLLLQRGRTAEADEWQQKALALGPDWPLPVGDLFRVHRSLAVGDPAAARSVLEERRRYEEASEVVGPSGQVRRNLYAHLWGEVVLAEGRGRDAVSHYRRVLPARVVGINPSDTRDLIRLNLPFRQDGLARAYAMTGEPREAIREYERLLEPDRTRNEYEIFRPIYHYLVGVLYEEQGDREAAKRHYRRFLEYWNDADPEAEEKRDAAARLARLGD